jgi:chemotaxis protein CheX
VGSIVLSFSNKVAAEMLSKLLGEPVTEFDDDVNDAVCEMVNIISGNACAELTSSGAGQISRALPQVIHGKGHSVKNPKNTPCINVLFETELGPFAMQISLKFNS